MPDNASNTERLRAQHRRSLVRHARCDVDLPRSLTDAILRGDLDQVLFSSEPLQVKDRCVVARHNTTDGSLLVKRHKWGGLWRTFRMAFRQSAARSCARLGLYLLERGIPTPRPRAHVDHRLGPWTYRSYLVSDYIEGESLYQYIRFGSQTTDELRHVARQVAEVWQKLVESGVSHNDMKPENFIVDRNLNVWLIDLEKVKIRGAAAKQRRRQVFDVNNFLHIRSWHHRTAARALFAEAFLRTRYGEWLRAAGVDRAAHSFPDESQIDPELSVLILCNGGIDTRLVRQAIDSVRDIADEVVLVESVKSGLEVLKRIANCEPPSKSIPGSTKAFSNPFAPPVARHEWVLLVEQNETITPFLAKEMQQRIADPKAPPAFRIALEPQYFNRTVAPRSGEVPVRLFRRSDCRIEADEAGATVRFDGVRVGRLTGTIQTCEFATVSEFIEHLNQQTTAAAARRLQAGERASMFGAVGRAAWQFLAACGRFRGMRSGWTGLQIAALEAAFSWVEEAKLYQLAGEFRPARLHDESSVNAVAPSLGETELLVAQKKAA